MRDELMQNGYCHLKGVDGPSFEQFITGLGAVILRTAVTVRPESRALVMSDKALDLHTDHQEARFIAWHCIRQTDHGGTSLVLDVGEVFDLLPEADRQRLAQIRFMAHRVFDGDPDEHPLLSQVNGHRRFYYAPFLVHSRHRAEPVLVKFRQLVREATPVMIDLEAGDVLVVDNHRMLHGRTAIFGSKDRQLDRCWIK
ncbi:MAG: TauD/TfdA family dioxygenase [Flavobacteriales bacterium]|nr:TauD/TfdA family dioxygenase [Flavobacteriales bacterium]